MKILVLNCGSSSLKYQLIDMSNEEVLCVGLVERIGIEGSVLKQEKDGVEGKLIVEQPMKNHQDAIKLVLDAVVDPQYGGVKDIKEVEAVGHRVVHGGEKFAGSVLITDEVKLLASFFFFQVANLMIFLAFLKPESVSLLLH